MRIDHVARRIAAAPRYVVLALVTLSLLISPGFVRIARESEHGLEPAREGTARAAREVAILELGCPDGVFGAECTRLIADVTRDLEQRADLFASVRSLANARVVRAERGALRLEPLALPAGDDAVATLALHARVRAEPALQRRFVAPSGRETFVHAELQPRSSSAAARAAVESMRAELGSAAGGRVTLLGVGHGRAALVLLLAAALALATLGCGLAPGGLRVAGLAGVGAIALAGFGHALLGLLGEPGRSLARFAPGLLVASALSSSFVLVQAARTEHRRERAPGNSVASALAAVGPGLAVGALVSTSGFAALFGLAPGIPRPLALGAAAALATALVAYPLGIALAGLVSWPGLLSRARGELAAVLARRAEHVLVRPRLVAYCAVLVASVSVCALAVIEPEPRELELRTVVLDSGARGGALEPEFLERVAAYQREAAQGPGVLWTRSLVDTVLAPANRAFHDGDPLFATVPLTRVDVVRALEPWLREARSTLAGEIDTEQRRIAVEVCTVPSLAASAPSVARACASAGLALVCVAALAALLLRSARGGLLCAVPAALTAAAVLGLSSAFAGGLHAAGSAIAPVAAAIGAGLGLQLLSRVRALLELGSQLEIALSLALRETGPSLASAALVSSALIAALGAASPEPAVHVVLALASPLVAAASVLVGLPPLVRLLRGRFFAERAALHTTRSAMN